MKDGDILLFHDGEMALVLEAKSPLGGMTRLLSVYDDEPVYNNTSSLKNMYENLGQDPHILALFYGTRSIHLRLNRMAKV